VAEVEVKGEGGHVGVCAVLDTARGLLHAGAMDKVVIVATAASTLVINVDLACGVVISR